jgi:hypothetical protein
VHVRTALPRCAACVPKVATRVVHPCALQDGAACMGMARVGGGLSRRFLSGKRQRVLRKRGHICAHSRLPLPSATPTP